MIMRAALQRPSPRIAGHINRHGLYQPQATGFGPQKGGSDRIMIKSDCFGSAKRRQSNKAS